MFGEVGGKENFLAGPLATDFPLEGVRLDFKPNFILFYFYFIQGNKNALGTRKNVRCFFPPPIRGGIGIKGKGKSDFL